MIYYFYIICIAPGYMWDGIDDYTVDLILNYNIYFNDNEFAYTKLYDYNWLIYLEFQELTSDKYFYVPMFLETIY